MAHSSFLVWNGTSRPLLYPSELLRTTVQSPKELTNIALIPGILGKPNKMPAISFTTNTLIEADTLVEKHKSNDQPCKDNYCF